MKTPCTFSPTDWINTCDYTPLELSLILMGTLFWNLAYVFIIRNGIRYRYVEMPCLAGSANFAWEFAWSFLLITDMGALFSWGLRGWFFLDIVIFALLLRFGNKQLTSPIIRPYQPLIEWTVFLFWIPVFYYFYQEGYDTSMGATSAYVITVVMEAMFIYHFVKHPPGSYFEPAVGWCRLFGNGAMSIFVGIKYPSMHFLQLLAVAVFVLDLIYVILQHRHATFNSNQVAVVKQPADPTLAL
ncbi:hypothetical protein ACFQ4C_11880 [Larkinella insperata]|uniref:Uncharacterized protein n=1 Tax=Larkinella insperata TaxID=332158 RepID=A0ABW3QM29_9BACT|nr:hypothetical protein [Larkinella insperata]